MGYLDAEQTAKAMTPDGWYRTGDLGRMDDDGFLHLAGRLSRFSKIGGEMVPHGTVEDALRKVMGLTDSGEVKVAVASTADPAKGEQLVVLHVDDIDAEAIRTALAAEGLANPITLGFSSFIKEKVLARSSKLRSLLEIPITFLLTLSNSLTIAEPTSPEAPATKIAM